MPSVLRPVPHADSIPVLVPKDIADCMPEWKSSRGDDDTGTDSCASVPFGHSVQLKESYENLSMFLKNIKYNEHK